MLGKVVSVVIVIGLMFFALVFLRVNYASVELETNYLEPSVGGIVDYGAVPVFAENLRFSGNEISYSISDDCDEGEVDDMVAAFNIFSSVVGNVWFYEEEEDADIKVGCSDEFIELGESLFAAGEGGPSRIINTSGFKVIDEGKIVLYNGNDCGYPIVPLHELCHVFGFDHTTDPDNIMYNTSACHQRMSDDMVDLMRELYSIESLGDVRFESATGTIHGIYLDFNISVLNEGLVGVGDVGLSIFADDNLVDVIELGEIDVGYGRTLKVENMNIGMGVDVVRLVLDADDLIEELDEGNNEVELSS